MSPAVSRSFDAAEANRIINDPSVLPTVAFPGVEKIDITANVADHANVLLLADGGAIFFGHDIEPGIYEVHTNFLSTHRGRHAIAASREAYRWMFTHTDCMTILTRVPAFNRAAALAARMVGFVPQFVRTKVWPTPDEFKARYGETVDVRFYGLSYEDWLRNAAAELIESGRAFFSCLVAERIRLGAEPKPIDLEDCQIVRIGAMIETLYGGQPEKAIILYNRWARFAGYGLVALVACNPLVIDVGDAVLMIGERSFKAAKIRTG